MVSHDTRERTRLFTSGASLELRLIAWLVLFEGYCGWLIVGGVASGRGGLW